MERVANRTERRPAFVGRAFADLRTATLQAGADLHSGRGRRGAGPEPHAEHRHHDQEALLAISVHNRLA